jgi:hypothetical protein
VERSRVVEQAAEGGCHLDVLGQSGDLLFKDLGSVRVGPDRRIVELDL